MEKPGFLYCPVFFVIFFICPDVFVRPSCDGIPAWREESGAALFSGIGNWFGFGYEVYPGYMEEPSKEVLEELDAMLQERRRELREAKRSETEKKLAE